MKKTAVILISLFVAVVISSCYSAGQLRERRILNNHEIFAGFSPAIREQVRQGNIDIGFSQNMVLLAWGPASRVVSRITEAGESTIWEYTKVESYYHPDMMSVPVRYADSRGKMRIVYHDVWLDYQTRREYTVARVEFVHGRVSVIERLNRTP